MIFGFAGIVGSYWQRTFEVGKAEIGLILFYVLAGAGLLMFLIGRLQEKIPPSVLMMLGAVVCGISTVVAGYAQSLSYVYLWAFLTGGASTFVYLPALTVSQIWSPERRGVVSGLVGVFSGLSGALMAPVFSHMLLLVSDQRMCFTIGFSTLVIGIASAAFIRLPETPYATRSAASDGGLADYSLKQSLFTKSFWLLWFTYAFAGAAGVAMVTLSESFGLSKGMAVSDAVFILTAFNLTNGASRLVSGFLSDLYGRKGIMAISFLCAGLAYFILPHIQNVFACSLFAMVIGFAFGTLFAVSAPFVSDCFGMKHFGAIFGLIFTAYGFVAGILGPYFGGYLLDITNGNFTIVFGYLGGLMIISSLMIWRTSPHVECSL